MKKFSLLIMLIILLVLTPQVKASEVDGSNNVDTIQQQMDFPLSFRCFNSAGTELTSGFNPNYNADSSSSIEGKAYYQCSSPGTAPMIVFNYNRVTDTNQLWGITMWIATDSQIAPSVSSIGIAAESYLARNQIIYSSTNATLYTSRVNGPFVMPNAGSTSINDWWFYSVYVVFSSKSNSTYFASQLSYSSNPGNLYLYGYNMEYMGPANSLSVSDVNSVISNSGFATASSVEEVEQSVAEVKEEITELNEQQQVTNEKLDDLNDNITSDEVSDDTGSSFFDDFEVSDNGGISQVITAPLVAINKMLEGTCTPLTATWRGKEVSLPCGYEFWAGMEDVKKFLNMVLGGFLCYGICRKLYLLIDRMKNPEDDRVEVMKL